MKLLLSLSIVLLTATICWAGITFDNVDDKVTIPDLGNWDNAMTMSMWYNPPSTTVVTGGLITMDSGSAGWAGLYSYNDPIPYPYVLFFQRDGTTDMAVTTSDSTLTPNVWQHIILTWTGSTTATTVHIYVNGVECTYQTQTNGVSFVATAAAWAIGNRAGGTSRPLNGPLTEVAYWDTVLSSADIASLYNNGKPIRGMPNQIAPTNLKLYLPMNDGEIGTSADGDTVMDKSGVGNNGTGVDGANNTGLSWSLDTFFRNRSMLIQ